ncbi:MAG: hypothetical protein E7101_08555 [Prevotella ruminicola]|uniref:Uncharacterized protein n=1 Tax=Xylanibacter ruminicola TaxID=839 RepID=A0A9D5P309_XYLRU|nr:hypothetical protein [Xylanibacter ruminicola]
MTANETIKKGWTREDFLALLERGRQIKARRQKEAEEWYAERQRRKKEAAESADQSPLTHQRYNFSSESTNHPRKKRSRNFCSFVLA